jgi:hypothetical protein
MKAALQMSICKAVSFHDTEKGTPQYMACNDIPNIGKCRFLKILATFAFKMKLFKTKKSYNIIL